MRIRMGMRMRIRMDVVRLTVRVRRGGYVGRVRLCWCWHVVCLSICFCVVCLVLVSSIVVLFVLSFICFVLRLRLPIDLRLQQIDLIE